MLYKGPGEVKILTKVVIALLIHHVDCRITFPILRQVEEIVIESSRLRM